MMRYPSNLKALYLDHNRLQTFHRETFSGQTSMDVLSMSDNKLDRIPAGVFVELINLFRLSLANNRIAVIEDNALTGLHRVRTSLNTYQYMLAFFCLVESREYDVLGLVFRFRVRGSGGSQLKIRISKS